MKDVERLVNEEIDNVTQKDWESYIHHAEKLQEEGFMEKIGLDEILEPVIINSQVSDDEDSDELQTDEDSDELQTDKEIDDDNNRNTDSEPLAVPLD